MRLLVIFMFLLCGNTYADNTDQGYEEFKALAKESCSSGICLRMKLNRYQSCSSDQCKEFTLKAEKHIHSVCANSSDSNCRSGKSIALFAKCLDMKCMQASMDKDNEEATKSGMLIKAAQSSGSSSSASSKKKVSTNLVGSAPISIGVVPSVGITPVIDAPSSISGSGETKTEKSNSTETASSNSSADSKKSSTSSSSSNEKFALIRKQNLAACQGEEECETQMNEYLDRVEGISKDTSEPVADGEVAINEEGASLDVAISGEAASDEAATSAASAEEAQPEQLFDLAYLQKRFGMTKAEILGEKYDDQFPVGRTDVCPLQGIRCIENNRKYYLLRQISFFLRGQYRQDKSSLTSAEAKYGACSVRVSEIGKEEHFKFNPGTLIKDAAIRIARLAYVGVGVDQKDCLAKGARQIGEALNSLESAKQPGRKYTGWDGVQGEKSDREEIRGACHSFTFQPRGDVSPTVEELLKSNDISSKEVLSEATVLECRESCEKMIYKMDASKGEDAICFIGDVMTTRKSARLSASQGDIRSFFKYSEGAVTYEECGLRYFIDSANNGRRRVDRFKPGYDYSRCVKTCDDEYARLKEKLNTEAAKKLNPKDFSCVYKPHYLSDLLSISERNIKVYPDIYSNEESAASDNGGVCELFNYDFSENAVFTFYAEDKNDCQEMGQGNKYILKNRLRPDVQTLSHFEIKFQGKSIFKNSAQVQCTADVWGSNDTKKSQVANMDACWRHCKSVYSDIVSKKGNQTQYVACEYGANAQEVKLNMKYGERLLYCPEGKSEQDCIKPYEANFYFTHSYDEKF